MKVETGSRSGVVPQGSRQIAAGRRQPDCGYLILSWAQKAIFLAAGFACGCTGWKACATL
jgi:hypothetical protein